MCCLMAIFLSACSVGKFGKAEGDYFTMNVPSGLIGRSKGEILKDLGQPDFLVVNEEIEYLGYPNHNGWYIYAFYVSFGKTEAKDLVLELNKNVVSNAYLVNQGFSIGILAAPSCVAN